MFIIETYFRNWFRSQSNASMFMELNLHEMYFFYNIMRFLKKKTSYLINVTEKFMIFRLWVIYTKVTEMSVVNIDNSPSLCCTLTRTSRKHDQFEIRSDSQLWWLLPLGFSKHRSLITPETVHLSSTTLSNFRTFRGQFSLQKIHFHPSQFSFQASLSSLLKILTGLDLQKKMSKTNVTLWRRASLKETVPYYFINRRIYRRVENKKCIGLNKKWPTFL